MNHSVISLEAARTYIMQLDFGYIIEAMSSMQYPLPRWTRVDAEHCAKLYKNFLILQKKHLSESLVPTREIDEFWHNHILYTKHYSQDCLHIFGHYLHHEPAAPNDNNHELVNAYLKTKQFYLAEFGVPLDLMVRIHN